MTETICFKAAMGEVAMECDVDAKNTHIKKAKKSNCQPKILRIRDGPNQTEDCQHVIDDVKKLKLSF